MGFSRQEYWSGLPVPSLLCATKNDQRKNPKPANYTVTHHVVCIPTSEGLNRCQKQGTLAYRSNSKRSSCYGLLPNCKTPDWELGTVPSLQGLCAPETLLCAERSVSEQGLCSRTSRVERQAREPPYSRVTSGLTPLLALPCGSKVRHSM